MFKVTVSPQAWDEFFEILDFIAADDPQGAARFCDALLDHTELLATFPHIGVPSRRRKSVRSVLHTPIRIYYRVDDARSGVEIIHFWHTARRNPRGL